MKEEINKVKKLLDDAMDVLKDFFEEKRSDTVFEKKKDSKKDKIALIKFSKSLIGSTNKINMRLKLGNKKELGDYVYEMELNENDKEPVFYIFTLNQGKPVKTIVGAFKDENWNGFKSVKKLKSTKKFLEYIYEKGIYIKGKKEKKEDALKVVVKALESRLKSVQSDVEEQQGSSHPLAVKIAKVVAIAAVTTIVSAALTPAAGVIAQEVVGGGAITGDVVGQAAEAAAQGLQSLTNPAELAEKVVKKGVSKVSKLPISKD